MTQQVAEYIDHMGDDKRVVDVARISFGPLKKVTTPEQDASLIRFLANGVTSKEKEQIINWIIKALIHITLMIQLRLHDNCTKISVIRLSTGHRLPILQLHCV